MPAFLAKSVATQSGSCSENHFRAITGDKKKPASGTTKKSNMDAVKDITGGLKAGLNFRTVATTLVAFIIVAVIADSLGFSEWLFRPFSTAKAKLEEAKAKAKAKAG